MARPRKCRRVCFEPMYNEFAPSNTDCLKKVILTVDEYEVIRLIDYEKQNQEQCAKQMNVARTTITQMYETARFKIADSLINGKQLLIKGGAYHICNGKSEYCKKNKFKCIREENKMRIAVTYENGDVFQHFGHSKQFKIYDVEDKKIINQEIKDTNGSGHGALSGLLKNFEVSVLICGGIGGGAKNALEENRIKICAGVSGNADDAVKKFINDELDYTDNANCNHHEHQHHHNHQCDHDKHGCKCE